MFSRMYLNKQYRHTPLRWTLNAEVQQVEIYSNLLSVGYGVVSCWWKISVLCLKLRVSHK